MSIVRKLMTASGVNTGTLTFSTPGTYSWQAPPGVSKIKSITGQGGSSTSSLTWAGITGFVYVFPINSTLGTPIGSTLAWSTVQSTMSDLVSAANGITTSPSGESTDIPISVLYVYNSNTLNWYYRPTTSTTRTYRRVGTVTGNATLSSKTGNVPTNISDPQYFYGPGLEAQGLAFTYGTNSTAFGLTFANNAASSTFTNVNITPGQTYTIVVGTDAGVDTSFISFEW